MTTSHRQRQARVRRVAQIRAGGLPLFSGLERNAVRAAMGQPSTEYVRWVDAAFESIAAAATAAKAQRLADLEMRDTNDPDKRVRGVFIPGDAVEFTPMHIQLTHPVVGTTATFTVRECVCELCALGRHVCTTDWLEDYSTHRHLHREVIRHRGAQHATELAEAPLIKPPRIAPRLSRGD